jgi:hypothetical protein
MKLYTVTTKVKECHGCKDVTFHWFYGAKRPEKRPYAELIEDYDPNAGGIAYTEDYIEEMFTEDEALQLKAYLDQRHDGDVNITAVEEVKLPIANNLAGFGAMTVGGLTDFCMLDREPEYSLPFKACGYLGLEGCERTGGSGVYDHLFYLIRGSAGAAASGRNGTAYEAWRRTAAERHDVDLPSDSIIPIFKETNVFTRWP